METTTCLMPDAAARDRAAAYIDAAVAAGKPIRAVREHLAEQYQVDAERVKKLIAQYQSASLTGSDRTQLRPL